MQTSLDEIRRLPEAAMFNPLREATLKTVALVGFMVLIVGAGVGQVLKSTVDNLLYWDATAAAESWAKYLAENVTDIEDIADGQPPSAGKHGVPHSDTADSPCVWFRNH
jgi:hypothetical protein